MSGTLNVRCAIAGGGPAGMMLGLLLARAGVEVAVLEKHADFLRDFRGDTVHPSTLQLMHELGLLESFLARPHDEIRQLRGFIGGEELVLADFAHVPTRCRFIALVPQWEFLDFLRDEAQRYPGFHLRMETEATGLIEERGRVAGIQARAKSGPLEVRAGLVVACDGRRSTLRGASGLPVHDLGATIDVLWMRLPLEPGDPSATGGRIGNGHMLATLNRGTYWQCAYVIPKGGIESIRARGLEALREEIAAIAPFLANRVGLLQSWDDVKLLSVGVDRLERWWKPGLLCIGDAAHAMSPVGGVGINLAVQDAVAAANVFAGPLADPATRAPALDALLPRVERRRLWPVRVVQAMQLAVHRRVLMPALAGSREPMKVPAAMRLMQHFPLLRALPAWFLGVGVRPEHVRSPAAATGARRGSE